MDPLLSPTNLQIAWFVLVGSLLTLYAVLDGFDLGAGIVHLAARTDRERRLQMAAIAPVWDGNEVYLVAGGGALFAAFPEVYATVFSGFYLALVLLLLALIFRAVSIEFRDKEPMPWWRAGWDAAYCASSTLAALLLGVALGNIVQGLPLDADHEYHGGLVGLLNPYSLLVGLTAVALFAQQGALWLLVRVEDADGRLRRVASAAIALFLAAYAALTAATLWAQPHMVANLKDAGSLWFVPGLALAAAAATPILHVRRRDAEAFLAGCLAVAGLMATFAIGVFPNMLRSAPDAANSLTVMNASSTPKTLGIMLTIACIGLPLVFAYTAIVYWVFRGKVKDGHDGY